MRKNRKYDPEAPIQSQFEDKVLNNEDLDSMETNQAGMIYIADLLKQQSKPQPEQKEAQPQPSVGALPKLIKFDEENI